MSGYHVQGMFFHGSSVAVAEYSGKAKVMTNPAEIGYGIYCQSPAGQSAGNLIIGNRILNFSNTAIYAGPSGIGDGWEVKDNHLFRNYDAYETCAGIQILSGNGHQVIGNFIGGSRDSASGKPLVVSRSVTTKEFTGIRINAGTGAQSLISKNTIANIHNFQFNLTGIDVLGGNVRIGGLLSTDGNQIGGSKNLSTIEYYDESLSYYDSTFNIQNNGELYARRIEGIVLANSSNAEVWNNQIKNISAILGFRGIDIQSSGNSLVRGNQITRIIRTYINTYLNPNIYLAGTMEPRFNGEFLEAIYVKSPNKNIEITSNEITRILNANSGDIRLIHIDNHPNNSAGTFSGNKIFGNILNLFKNNRSISTGNSSYISIIENAEDSDAGTQWTFANNMVMTYGSEGTLGANSQYFSVITHKSASGGSAHQYLHNTLFLGGGVGNGFSDNEEINSVAFLKQGATPCKLRNNLFVNTRGRYNSDAGSFSREIIFGLNNTSGFDSDYNIFSLGKHYSVCIEGPTFTEMRFVAGTGATATLGKNFAPISLSQLQALTGGDVHSIQTQPSWEIEPQLFSAHINAAIDGNLKLSANNLYISGKGENVGITTDFYGSVRNTTPDIGAHEFSSNPEINNSCYWTGAKNDSWFDPENWVQNRIPDSTRSAVISNEPFKPHMPFISSGVATVKDLTITAEGGSTVYLRESGELRIFGNATGWKDSSLIQSGGLVTFAKPGGEQLFSSLRRGEIVRGPIWGLQNRFVGYDMFYVKSRVKSAINNAVVTSTSIELTTVSPHGLANNNQIVFSGYTGDLADLNGKSFPITVVSPTSFSVPNPGISDQTSASTAYYTFLRRRVEINTTNCTAGNCTLTTKSPHGFYKGRLIYLLTGNPSTAALKQFATVDSVLSELSFTVKRSLTASFVDNTGANTCYAMCTGYENIRIAGGGVKRPEGVFEVCGNIDLQSGILISDENEKSQSLIASAHQTWNIQPVKMLVMKKFTTVLGTRYPSYTGGSANSYIQGDVAVLMGKEDQKAQRIPLGFDGKFRPVEISIQTTGSQNPSYQYYMVARWKPLVEQNLTTLPLDEVSLGEKITRILGKSYLEVVPHSYDLAMFPSSVSSSVYSPSTNAIYILNLFTPISYPRDNISNIQVGLSFKPEDFDVPAFKYKDLRVVSDFGLPELGSGFSPTYRPYRAEIWRNTGVDAVATDSTSDTKFVRGTRVAQAFNFVVGTTDINLVSNEPLVEEIARETNGISTFPNPNSGDFRIVAKEEIESIFIFDVMGRNLYSQNQKNGTDFTVRQKDWSPKTGIYLLRVKTHNQVLSSKISVR